MFASFLFTHAVRQNARFNRLLPWILAGFFMAGIAALLASLGGNMTPDDRYTNVTLMMVYRAVALAAAVFSATIVSQEVEQKTIVYLLTRPTSRATIIFSRYVGGVVVVALLGMFMQFCTGLGAYGPAELGQGVFYRDLLAIAIGSAAYMAVFLLISLLVNRAMLFCILYTFGYETATGNLPGESYYASIMAHMQGISQHAMTSGSSNRTVSILTGQSSSNLLTGKVSIPVLLIVSVVAIGLCMAWFTHFEYMPREDAE
jgi:ABC-2 type transport system permease protein